MMIFPNKLSQFIEKFIEQIENLNKFHSFQEFIINPKAPLCYTQKIISRCRSLYLDSIFYLELVRLNDIWRS